MPIFRLLLLLVLALSLAAPSAMAQGRRVALLMGNQAYPVGGLRYPAQDVATVRAALLSIGFKPDDVAVLNDGDQKKMRRALADFGDRARGAEVAFLYYSGHATQARGQNWLIPIGAEVRKEADYELEAVSAQAALTQLQEAAPRLSVVVLDACRDNPVAVTKSGTKGLGRMEAGASTVLAFATAPNATAADNGLYAKVLAKHLRQPGLEILDVFRNTGADVRAATQGAQAPRMSEVDLPTRFFLAGASPGVNPNANVVPEPVTPGLDLSDLAGQAARQAEADRREQAALARMQADFDKVTGFTGAAALQAQAWERFLAAWTANNAPGANGQALRTQAEQRLAQARVEANRPAPQPVPVTTTANASGKACPECPETVTLQPGSFQMGSPSSETGRGSDEGPTRTVRIGQQLAVGKTHITRGEFATFVNASGYRTEAEQGDGCFTWSGSEWKKTAGSSWRNPGFEQGSDHPVVCVSWNDAQKYIEWLNGKSPVKGWRLLTEAEWEYAARAGSSTRYYWGDDSGNNQQCQFANGADQNAKRTWNANPTANCDDGHAYTAPVGRYKANAWGLHDMAGNAWQWTQDCYAQSYDGAPSNGQAVNPSSCSRRVLRGGSWFGGPQGLRSAERGGGTPGGRSDGTGFRLARTVF